MGRGGKAGSERHQPQRTCVACRERRPQRELLRVVRGPGGFSLDPGRRLAGRGAYVCPDRAACGDVKRLKRFARAEAERLAALITEYAASRGDIQGAQP